jgi:DNA-binding PadR family transcriptional regulator
MDKQRSERAMATGRVNLRYFVLGLLAQQPMSGYDIRRFLKNLSWLIGSPGGGSIYPILRGLLQDELVTVEVFPGIDRPPRKVYTITEAGRRALQAWIEQPAEPKAPMKAFVMRLLLADSYSQASLAATFEQRRAQVVAHYNDLRQAVGVVEEDFDRGQHMALDYGLALASAELSWLDLTLEQLAQRSAA